MKVSEPSTCMGYVLPCRKVDNVVPDCFKAADAALSFSEVEVCKAMSRNSMKLNNQ